MLLLAAPPGSITFPERPRRSIVTMLAPQANNNRFGSKEKKLKATLKFSAAFKTKVSCAGASGAGLSCRWLTAPARRWT